MKPRGRRVRLGAVPGREREFELLFRQALDYVAAIGGRQIHVLAGTVPPEQRPAAQTTFIKNLARAGDAAAEHGITLLIEPINPRDRPDYFLTRVEHAADVIARVERPNLRMQFDFYHAQIVGGDLIRRFAAHLAVIGHVQVAAVPSRREPDEGEVSYPGIFAELDRLGYAGYISAEYRPRGRTEDGLDWAHAHDITPRPT
jgi:2-dehydrotetronate isomerase